MDDAAAGHDDLRAWATDGRLADARSNAAARAAPNLTTAGRQLHISGHVIGDGRTTGASQRGNGDDAQVAVGVLAQIAGDLLDASASLLGGTNHYAGAALLRQVVEVEYLSWAFSKGHRDAAEWLNSTHQDRRRFFQPVHLRGLSEGRFSDADYRHHCEQGGHPVPRAIALLGGSDVFVAQMLLVDLLLHGWRTTDHLLEWADQQTATSTVTAALREAQAAFAAWGRLDPLYEWSLTAPPAPPP
jgi:hypothetical protein